MFVYRLEVVLGLAGRRSLDLKEVSRFRQSLER